MLRRWKDLTGSEEFGKYFETYILSDFARGCLAGVRRSAGLGENFFYTNAIESTDNKLKTFIRQDKQDSQKSGKVSNKCTWTEAILQYAGMMALHFRNLERAIIDEGK